MQLPIKLDAPFTLIRRTSPNNDVLWQGDPSFLGGNFLSLMQSTSGANKIIVVDSDTKGDLSAVELSIVKLGPYVPNPVISSIPEHKSGEGPVTMQQKNVLLLPAPSCEISIPPLLSHWQAFLDLPH